MNYIVCLKASSREIPNEPYTSLNYENTEKNLALVVQIQNFTPKNTFEELNW